MDDLINFQNPEAAATNQGHNMEINASVVVGGLALVQTLVLFLIGRIWTVNDKRIEKIEGKVDQLLTNQIRIASRLLPPEVVTEKGISL